MTHILNNMTLNLNYNHRRYNGSSKSWCRVPVMARTFGNSPFLSHKFQKPFCTSSKLEKTKKIFKRNFRNKYACRNFMKNLNQGYFRRFKQNINFKLNLRGNKIMYYSGAKIGK